MPKTTGNLKFNKLLTSHNEELTSFLSGNVENPKEFFSIHAILLKNRLQLLIDMHQTDRRDTSNCSIFSAKSCFPQFFSPSVTKSKHLEIGVNPISVISTK
ncbi:hypothetical protein CICLE_v10023022mg [Citrus x clementina]|uniref:Uncharacterized protein n=1 Tax=Citrus clementina TaxID=85681 RepID=V4TSV8_CITCL|nr:hypothetical protein CICLE_v10023022mg [Citrus x clementina]